MPDCEAKWITFARIALGIGEDKLLRAEPIATGGSDRSIFRIVSAPDSYILIHYGPEKEENGYYVSIARFLQGIGFPVPNIIAHNDADRCIIMEDAGKEELWNFRGEPWEVRRRLYEKVLREADRLHSFPLNEFPKEAVSLMQPFGPELYLWERSYFGENFLTKLCRIEMTAAEETELEAELRELALSMDMCGRCLVHRDLQSKNILIRDDNPVFVDFQGMREGSPFYDLASLLYDPYVDVSAEERSELLRHYYDLRLRNSNWEGFQRAFYSAAVQRLMQALGAYGFLSLEMGKKEFLVHVPAAVRNLLDAGGRSCRVPGLTKLMLRCRALLGLR
ncbi:MAG: phosphotransferase [Smithellaceae bacterium]|nr:phosphotransferase [Smithellaceae bacterium]